MGSVVELVHEPTGVEDTGMMPGPGVGRMAHGTSHCPTLPSAERREAVRGVRVPWVHPVADLYVPIVPR